VTYDAVKASILLMLNILEKEGKKGSQKILIEDINNTLYLVKYLLKKNIGELADKYLDFRVDCASRLGLKSRDISRIFSNLVNNRLIMESENGFQLTRIGFKVLGSYIEGSLHEFLKDVENAISYLLENFSLSEIEELAKKLYYAELEKKETEITHITIKILSGMKNKS